MKPFMEVVKKNIWSVICGIIALVAVVAYFYPADGMYSDLKSKVDRRASAYTTLVHLLQTPRYSPGNLGDTEPLKTFPSAVLIAEGNKAEADFAKASTAVYAQALLSNQAGHDLLVPNSLPSPATDAIAFDFLSKYPRQWINIRDKILDAGVPPTQAEQDKMANDLFDSSYASRIITINGTKVNEAAVMSDWNADAKQRKLTMHDVVATGKKIYALPECMALAHLQPQVIPDPMTIWRAQMRLWVLKDIASAVAGVNASSENILSAPIKQLVRVDVPDDIFTPTAGTAADLTGDMPKDFSVALTGRVPNSVYDIVRFGLILNVDADQVASIVQRLTDGRFLTITRVDAAPVPPETISDAGYVYGPARIVQLTMEGEYLYLRDWTVPYMPNTERNLLKVPADWRPSNAPAPADQSSSVDMR